MRTLQHNSFIALYNTRELNYHIPIEIIVPRDPDEIMCIEEFADILPEICYVRNNHAEYA